MYCGIPPHPWLPRRDPCPEINGLRESNTIFIGCVGTQEKKKNTLTSVYHSAFLTSQHSLDQSYKQAQSDHGTSLSRAAPARNSTAPSPNTLLSFHLLLVYRPVTHRNQGSYGS